MPPMPWPHGPTWPQILNCGAIPTAAYGIQGLPQIMLMAPVGPIVARDLRGERLTKLVEKVMSEQK